ncbi:UDP-glucuronosyltransferase 2A1-like [Parambassis ranga]|uniref:glucuronosyltransferase n=1 Tax=Parambassis ranga TaxID=210632 RepID=A0A6P7IZP8_9TELE|nr:UDP-glucuronosyltransferase 2A1-like [Parambassis ranga]
MTEGAGAYPSCQGGERTGRQSKEQYLKRIRPQPTFQQIYNTATMELHRSVCVLLALCVPWSVKGGNVLVWYTEGSHWINMKPVLDALMDKGHQVTVLVPSVSMFMNSSEPSRFRYELFNVSVSLQEMEDFLEEFFHFSMYEIDHMNYLQLYIRFMDLFKRDLHYAFKYLDGVVKSEATMKKLREGNYDVLLADPIFVGSDLTADILGIPLVYTLRFSLAHNWERQCGQLPAPPSFVPGAMSKLTDKMDFSERVWNFLFYALQDAVVNYIMWNMADEYYSEVKGKPTNACELMGRADIWLMRTYWDFDFPRPFLPNFKFIGGIHCKPAKPLPKEMEEFVQSSGDAGLVIFTLGSMIKNITTEKGNMIASALAQIPQKVLWRYSGEKPATVGPNTRIYNWIPQNDLLGHPKTKAFVTHGGTNGIYEAIYHGVPMVGIPMFADQPDNLVHMKAKGAAVTVDLNFMTTEDLKDAINTVINDKSYKENAMRLSSIHHDRPLSPLDEAVFWLEFTMRNKGAKNLRVAAHELTWYQYHSLDVLAFLFAVILLFMLIIVKSCSFCFRRCCGRKGKTKRKAE